MWTAGSIAASHSAVLSITALVTQTGDFTNTATKTAANEPDPNPANDSGSVTATANRVADLSVTKTDGVDSVVAGLTDTYTITVANAGPSAVTGASVADTFPAALTGVTWTCSGHRRRELRGGERCGSHRDHGRPAGRRVGDLHRHGHGDAGRHRDAHQHRHRDPTRRRRPIPPPVTIRPPTRP